MKYWQVITSLRSTAHWRRLKYETYKSPLNKHRPSLVERLYKKELEYDRAGDTGSDNACCGNDSYMPS